MHPSDINIAQTEIPVYELRNKLANDNLFYGKHKNIGNAKEPRRFIESLMLGIDIPPIYCRCYQSKQMDNFRREKKIKCFTSIS